MNQLEAFGERNAGRNNELMAAITAAMQPQPQPQPQRQAPGKKKPPQKIKVARLDQLTKKAAPEISVMPPPAPYSGTLGQLYAENVQKGGLRSPP